jgi:hypothetical protein
VAGEAKELAVHSLNPLNARQSNLQAHIQSEAAL